MMFKRLLFKDQALCLNHILTFVRKYTVQIIFHIDKHLKEGSHYLNNSQSFFDLSLPFFKTSCVQNLFFSHN